MFSDLKRQDFFYQLPKELIAQTPLLDRSASRLMLLNKSTGKIGHDVFKNIISHFRPGDCLVLNDTRVIPARLYGTRSGTGGAVEFLLLHKLSLNIWEILAKPGRSVRPGNTFEFGDGRLRAKVVEVFDKGNRVVEFSYSGVFEEVLDELGEMPLPHYITEKLSDKERYQTVYSKNNGSSAAPTAGLHFTEELLSSINNVGIDTAYLTLHVGLGTFRPVKVDNITEHNMHSEYYSISPETAVKINDAKRNGGRVIAVGTTANRVLETVSDENGITKAGSGWTDIFICPGYRFKCSDALITNFHLPESTLIMLVSAFAGHENTMRAYETAVREKYRFFSFGDAMFIS